MPTAVPAKSYRNPSQTYVSWRDGWRENGEVMEERQMVRSGSPRKTSSQALTDLVYHPETVLETVNSALTLGVGMFHLEPENDQKEKGKKTLLPSSGQIL